VLASQFTSVTITVFWLMHALSVIGGAFAWFCFATAASGDPSLAPRRLSSRDQPWQSSGVSTISQRLKVALSS
jgi:hypothetical protein